MKVSDILKMIKVKRKESDLDKPQKSNRFFTIDELRARAKRADLENAYNVDRDDVSLPIDKA